MSAICDLTLPQVNEAFLAAQPLLAKTIYNFTVRSPRWLRDIWQLEEFPLGQGTTMQQLVMRGQMPQIERGFAAWKQLGNNTGCNPCEGPDCSYNITPFGGTAIEVKAMNLMERDFQSPTYCIKQIQTTAHFDQIFSQVVLNLYMQIDFFKEQNIGFNYLTSLAKKLICDSEGLKPNKENPYVYRPKGTATLSALNIEGLTQIYEWFRLQPTAVPYDVVNGQPIYALECSMELISRLYRDDPQLRQDVRFSGYANNLVTDYNFMSTIRGMFIVAPILYPRRFKWTGTQWLEVLPFINGVVANTGSYTDINDDYIDPSVSTHEEVLMHGKNPFKIYYLPTATTLGESTSFGPEYSFMNAWQWINPLTPTDPARREGFFFTSATIGLAPQYSESIYGWLVERAPKSLAFAQNPQASCPVSPPDCGNTVPDVGCPCSLITNAFLNPVTGDTIIELAVPLAPVPSADDTIQFGIDTGGYLVGTVVASATDGSSVEVTFPDGTDLGVCDHFTSIFCDNTMGCYALVQSQCVNGSHSVAVVLANAIKADVADVITITTVDGTVGNATVSAVNYSTLTWTLTVTATIPGDLTFGCNDRSIVSLCVPTSADASCPGCGGPSYTQCET